ncbi:MAG TPA: hypothetical protein VHW65_07400 [Gemmatimonadales bacterium]|nr:hypothetical protein [Gemmatimonadales bacterium]
MIAALLFPLTLVAQGAPTHAVDTIPRRHAVHLTGHVLLNRGADSTPAAATRLILHGVTPTVQGPIDSLLTTADGAFDLHFTADTGVVYLLSARWAGIEYFALPLDTREGSPRLDANVVVADTSAAAPVALSARHLLVSAPAATGTRDVLDLAILTNAGPRTRVPTVAAPVTWRMLLPHAAINARVGDAEFATETMIIHGDTLALTAPIPPGQRSISVTYQLPPNISAITLTVAQPVPTVNLLMEEPGAHVTGGLVRADSQLVNNGRSYTRWSGAVVAGQGIVIRFPGSVALPPWVLPVLVGAFALGLVAVGALAFGPARTQSH